MSGKHNESGGDLAPDRAARFGWAPGDLEFLTPDEVEQLLRPRWLLVQRAVELSATEMAQQSNARASPLVERDLEVCFAAALKQAGDEANADVRVSPQRSVQLHEWPRVGRCDLHVDVRADEDWDALFELKWGADTLYNCVWDLAKTACAVAAGESARGYLVAGAPETDWTAPVSGAEIFASSSRRAATLFEQYPKLWAKWANDVKTRPVQLPSWIVTRVVAAVPLLVLNNSWQLRCVEVTAIPDWWDVPPYA